MRTDKPNLVDYRLSRKILDIQVAIYRQCELQIWGEKRWSIHCKKNFVVPSEQPPGNEVGAEGGHTSIVRGERNNEKEGGLLRLNQQSYRAGNMIGNVEDNVCVANFFWHDKAFV